MQINKRRVLITYNVVLQETDTMGLFQEIENFVLFLYNTANIVREQPFNSEGYGFTPRKILYEIKISGHLDNKNIHSEASFKPYSIMINLYIYIYIYNFP